MAVSRKLHCNGRHGKSRRSQHRIEYYALAETVFEGTPCPARWLYRLWSALVFDAGVGDDDLFHGDRYKWSLRLTAINLTNKVALYDFLSTFSGKHFVTPRTYTAELGFHF